MMRSRTTRRDPIPETIGLGNCGWKLLPSVRYKATCYHPANWRTIRWLRPAEHWADNGRHIFDTPLNNGTCTDVLETIINECPEQMDFGFLLNNTVTYDFLKRHFTQNPWSWVWDMLVQARTKSRRDLMLPNGEELPDQGRCLSGKMDVIIIGPHLPATPRQNSLMGSIVEMDNWVFQPLANRWKIMSSESKKTLPSVCRCLPWKMGKQPPYSTYSAKILTETISFSVWSPDACPNWDPEHGT